MFEVLLGEARRRGVEARGIIDTEGARLALAFKLLEQIDDAYYWIRKWEGRIWVWNISDGAGKYDGTPCFCGFVEAVVEISRKTPLGRAPAAEHKRSFRQIVGFG